RLAALRIRDPIEEDLGLPEGTVLREILALRRAIVERSGRDSRKNFRLLRSGRSFAIRGTGIRVRCLTPGDRAIVKYREGLAAGLKQAFPGTDRDRPKAVKDWCRPNLASTALAFAYGRTRLL